MNAISPESASSLPAQRADGRSRSLRITAGGTLAALPLWAILTGFWIYVAVSNVLYAHSMAANMDPNGTEHFFASWDARVLQHLFLYPVLLICIYTSLRVGWRPPWRAVPIQLLLGLTFAALAAPFLWMAESALGHDDPTDPKMSWGLRKILAHLIDSTWVAQALNFILTYGFGLALITGFVLYQRFRDSELRLAALERAWSGARLAALRMQLSPHTLFNLLHTIRGQIAWNPDTAQSMIVQLGDLLRRLLAAGERDFSRLADEVQFARLYLELQQQRFTDRLSLALPDAARLPQAWVPSLILQPLIENAVVHGLSGHEGPVTIRVEIDSTDEVLVMRVVNTTAPYSARGQDGIGLRNVRERLAVHFGGRATFSAGSGGSPKEWIAEVRTPLLLEGRPARLRTLEVAP